jgi:hypothetical protein
MIRAQGVTPALPKDHVSTHYYSPRHCAATAAISGKVVNFRPIAFFGISASIGPGGPSLATDRPMRETKLRRWHHYGVLVT